VPDTPLIAIEIFSMPQMGYKQSKEHTDRVQVSKLLNRVESHALGDIEMEATQLTAAEMLFSRTLPKLSAVQQHIEIEGGLTVSVVLGD
jgi:hypothetical protein